MRAFLARRTGRASPFPHYGVLFPDTNEVFHNIDNCMLEPLGNFARKREHVKIIAKLYGTKATEAYLRALKQKPIKWRVSYNCIRAAKDVFFGFPK